MLINHWPVNHIDWPGYCCTNCPSWTKPNDQARICIWDTEFVAGIVGSIETDSDLGGKRRRLCRSRANRVRLSRSSSHRQLSLPATHKQKISAQGKQVAQIIEGLPIFYQPAKTESITLARHDHLPSRQFGRGTDYSDRSQQPHSGQWERTCRCNSTCECDHPRGLVMTEPGAGSMPTIPIIPVTGTETLEEEPLHVDGKQCHCLCKSSQLGTN